MRKLIIDEVPETVSSSNQRWLDLEALAKVEVSSEDAAHPIESALLPGNKSGWRAAQPGAQTIRLLFDEPQQLRRVHFVFTELDHERTQQFVLRWSSDREASYREIVRQQYNFSPPGVARECEDYSVDLVGLTALELSIVPDISGAPTLASLEQLRLS